MAGSLLSFGVPVEQLTSHQGPVTVSIQLPATTSSGLTTKHHETHKPRPANQIAKQNG